MDNNFFYIIHTFIFSKSFNENENENLKKKESMDNNFFYINT